jgi:hypothetical protein
VARIMSDERRQGRSEKCDGEREPQAWLSLINSDAKVLVDADLLAELRSYEWVLASGHVISHSREGWQGLINLAWHIAGPGFKRKPGAVLDFRRRSLVPAGRR